MNDSKFKPEYEKWAYQIFDESVECLKDGLHTLSLDIKGKTLVVNEKKREHAVFCIVRYLELCNGSVHDYLSRANMDLFAESHSKTNIKANVRALFTKFIEDMKDLATPLERNHYHFLNFLQWLTPLVVETD